MDMALAGRGFSVPDLTKSLAGPGHVEVKEGKIEGINLMQEAVTLLKVAGVSIDDAKATAFSTIETDVTGGRPDWRGFRLGGARLILAGDSPTTARSAQR